VAQVPPKREGLFKVLVDAVSALDKGGLRYVVGGGLAAEAYHLRETLNDIDLFVRPVDAPTARHVLANAGFYVWIEDPRWLYKGLKDNITVDVIYESAGLLHVSDETFRRARMIPIEGAMVPVMPPEDLFVMKAAAANPAEPKHWLDAISLLASQPMDWQYLAEISTPSPRKVLRAILHAYDEGLQVPSFVFVRLAEAVIT
jgi:predicted nucleotidyltransferase